MLDKKTLSFFAAGVLVGALAVLAVGYVSEARLSQPEGSGQIENTQCPVHGAPLRWAAAYCMTQVGTDNPAAAMQSDCGKQAAVKTESFTDPCKANAYWKSEICRFLVDNQAADEWENDAARCSADPEFYPEGVDGGA